MRLLSNDVKSAIAADVVRVALLFHMEMGDNVVYLSSTNHNISWAEQIWLGNGWLRPFSNISEVAEVGPTGLKIRIGGLDAVAVSGVLGNLALRNRCWLYLAMLTQSRSVILDPFLIYSGFFDQAELRDDGSGSEIMLSYENSRIRLQNANELRYTDQCQQAIYAGDKGFEYAPQAADWSGFWGKAAKVKFIRRRKTTSGRS